MTLECHIPGIGSGRISLGMAILTGVQQMHIGRLPGVWKLSHGTGYARAEH